MLVDLGASPLCEQFLRAEDLDRMEPTYPLRPMVCETCFLVQLPAYVPPADIFTEYAYFSSYSTSWLEHSRAFAERITADRGLGPGSLVVELGSNDGYLLRQFVALGVPVLGIEPAANVAEAATAAGVRTLVRFFDAALAEELRAQGTAADLIVANNTLAQIPDLNDAVAGLATLLAPDGRLSIEVPHLLRLLDEGQFDTIYHEHFSYFSLLALRWILERHGLVVEDVEELPTHGGSLRVIAGHAGAVTEGPRVTALLAVERERGLDRADGLRGLRGTRGADQGRGAGVPPGAEARGPAGRGLRGTGQGEHAAQLRRDPERPARLHGRPQPLQARAVHARHPDPDPAARAPRGGPAGRDLDPALESRAGDRRPARRPAGRLAADDRHPAADDPGSMRGGRSR